MVSASQVDLPLSLVPDSVTVLTRDAAAFARQAPYLANDAALTLHPGDVRNFVFPQGHFDYLIHGATTSASETFHGEDPLRKFDTLVDGTRRVLDFAVQCEVERFLFLSSGVAYGTQPADMSHIPESYQGAPDTSDVDTSLGQAKRAAEYLSTYYAHKHGWNNTIARCFSFVGPFMPLDLHYAIGNFIHQALHEEEIMVKGDNVMLEYYKNPEVQPATDSFSILPRIYLQKDICNPVAFPLPQTSFPPTPEHRTTLQLLFFFS